MAEVCHVGLLFLNAVLETFKKTNIWGIATAVGDDNKRFKYRLDLLLSS